MDDGGDDWTKEKGDGTKDSAMPLISVFVAVGAFFIVLTAIALGSVAMDMWSLARILNPSDETRTVSSAQLAAGRVRRVASQAARDMKLQNREDNKQAMEQLTTDLMEAAFGDFDAARRDEIARQMIELTPRDRRASMLTRVFAQAGAHDQLLELGPSEYGGWYEVAVLRGDWDRISALDVETDDVFSLRAARAFCLAGAQGKALGVFKWSLGENPFSERTIADAIACGATEENLGVELFAKPHAEIAQTLAARGAEQLPKVYARWSKNRKFRRTARMEAGAALYLDGVIDANELSAAGKYATHYCWSPPVLDETTPPGVLLAVAEKLKTASVEDKEARAKTVEALRVTAALSGMARLEDHRGSWDVEDEKLEPCLALVEYEFEPAAAVTRLQRWIKKSDKPRWEAHRLLALAHARTGDYDAAFEQAKQVLEHSKDSHASRSDGNTMVLAFGHLSGRLDEVELMKTHEAAAERERLMLAALEGTEEQRRPLRVQTERQPGLGMMVPVGYYLRATLAPGHEEEFLDGLWNEGTSLSRYMWGRAEAARWLGNSEAEQKWKDRRAALHARQKDGANGGLRLLFVRL